MGTALKITPKIFRGLLLDTVLFDFKSLPISVGFFLNYISQCGVVKFNYGFIRSVSFACVKPKSCKSSNLRLVQQSRVFI